MTAFRTEKGVVIGNTYDKYTTRNPIARHMVSGFLRSFDEMVDRSSPSVVIEVGCGEGELALRLARRGLRVRASDLSEEIIEVARERAGAQGLDVGFEVADILAVQDGDPPADLVVCCEVLEHLPEPEAALRHLAGLGAPQYLFSVPREPLWRVLNMLRGRYLRDLGNTPGHLQNWSHRSFAALVGRSFEIMELRAPLPWTMVLARPLGQTSG